MRSGDHDFGPDAPVPPVGLLVVKTRELFLYMVVSKGTADCHADVVEHWWASYKPRCPGVGTLARTTAKRTRVAARSTCIAL